MFFYSKRGVKPKGLNFYEGAGTGNFNSYTKSLIIEIYLGIFAAKGFSLFACKI